MPKKAAIKEMSYIVQNPMGIPNGIALIRWREHAWFEGDVLVPPPGLNMDRLIRDRYVMEAPNG